MKSKKSANPECPKKRQWNMQGPLTREVQEMEWGKQRKISRKQEKKQEQITNPNMAAAMPNREEVTNQKLTKEEKVINMIRPKSAPMDNT